MTASLATASKMSSPSTASSQNSLMPRRKRLCSSVPIITAPSIAPDDRSGAAKDVDAADDDRGDHAELQAASGLDRDVAEAREKHEAAEPREGAADDEGEENDALDRQSDQLRRLGIGADRVEASGETQIGRSELEHDDDDEREHEQGANVETRRSARR